MPLWIILILIIGLITYFRRNQQLNYAIRTIQEQTAYMNRQAMFETGVDASADNSTSLDPHNQRQSQIPNPAALDSHNAQIQSDNSDLPAYTDLENDLPSYKKAIRDKY